MYSWAINMLCQLCMCEISIQNKEIREMKERNIPVSSWKVCLMNRSRDHWRCFAYVVCNGRSSRRGVLRTMDISKVKMRGIREKYMLRMGRLHHGVIHVALPEENRFSLLLALCALWCPTASRLYLQTQWVRWSTCWARSRIGWATRLYIMWNFLEYM